MVNDIPVDKNEDLELPIPTIWRAKISEIVSIIRKVPDLNFNNISYVDKMDPKSIRFISAALTDYGGDIGPASMPTWVTSVYRWMNGYWQVLVDLYSGGEPTDLVLFMRVVEIGGEYRFCVESIHVP